MIDKKEYELVYSTIWSDFIQLIFYADSDEEARQKVPEIIKEKKSKSWGQEAEAKALIRWDYETDKSKRDFRHMTEIPLT